MNLYSRIVSLPLYPAMSEEEVYYVASSVNEVLDRSRRARVVSFGMGAAVREETPVLPRERATPYE
jgi:hypothetical protein